MAKKVSKSTLIVYYDGAEGKANAMQAIRKMHAEILYDLKEYAYSYHSFAWKNRISLKPKSNLKR